MCAHICETSEWHLIFGFFCRRCELLQIARMLYPFPGSFLLPVILATSDTNTPASPRVNINQKDERS